MTYADGYNVRDDTVNFNSIANALDGLLAAVTHSKQSSLLSHSSTSYTDYTNVYVTTTVAAGEAVACIAGISASNGTANEQIGIQIYRDTTAIGSEMFQKDTTGGTDGLRKMLVTCATETPSAGTYTYKLRWRASAGTVYSQYGWLAFAKLRVS